MKADRGSSPRLTDALDDDETAADRRKGELAGQAPAHDAVEESSKDSFPASDPPSWWAGIEAPVRRGAPSSHRPRP